MLDAVHTVTTTHSAGIRTESAARQDSPRAPSVVTASDQLPVASPQITVDPVVGVIVQFLNSSGRVETQSPSFAAEAYLRAGLTADGFSKTDAETHTQVTV